MSIVSATYRRDGSVVVQTFEDHLGNVYSQTHRGTNMTDQQLQARVDAAADELAQRLADTEINQQLGDN